MTDVKSIPSVPVTHQTTYSLLEILNLLAVGYRSIEDICTAIRPAVIDFCENVKLIISSPPAQHLASVVKLHTLIHPVLIEISPNGFTEMDLKDSWPKIQEALLARYPENLDCELRRARHSQIMECQKIGAYIPVCRSIYPEIEALLRSEILLADPDWKSKWDEHQNPRDRRNFQSNQLNLLARNQLPNFYIADPSATLGEVGIYTAEFVYHLQLAFDSFDPANADEMGHKGFRHLHAHGWADQATFIDGLSGLLIFDLALQSVSQIKAEKQSKRNGDHKND